MQLLLGFYHSSFFSFQLFIISEEDSRNPDCVWVKAWLPIMFELSTIINRCKLDVRTRYRHIIIIMYPSNFVKNMTQ
jgi:hypothetical protein